MNIFVKFITLHYLSQKLIHIFAGKASKSVRNNLIESKHTIFTQMISYLI